MSTCDYLHFFNFFKHVHCSVDDSLIFYIDDHYVIHVNYVVNRNSHTLRVSVIRDNAILVFDFDWFFFTRIVIQQIVFFWEVRHKCVYSLDHFGNKDHTHST